MVCFFCDSISHPSQNCNKYITIEDRKRIACVKNCCENCLHQKNGDIALWCCKEYRKCFVCLSRSHHTVYCEIRVKADKIFLPNIDKILLTRFLKCFNLPERYLLAFTCKKAFNFLSPKEIIVIEDLKIESNIADKNFNENSVLISTLYIKEIDNVFENVLSKNSVSLKFLDFKIKNITIFSSTLTAEDFLKLLNIKITNLTCFFLKLTSKVKFAEILKKAPNLKEITLLKSEIQKDTWSSDLNTIKNCIKVVHLSLESFNFDVKDLVQFLKHRIIRVTIHMNITYETFLADDETYKIFKEMLSIYFNSINKFTFSNSILKIFFKDNNRGYDRKYYEVATLPNI